MSLWIPGVPRTTTPTHGTIRIGGVVCHRTYGSWGGDLGVMRGSRGGIGFHLLVGKDEGQWFQGAALDRECWHAKGANSNTIGIEATGTNGDPMTDWQVRALARICSEINRMVGIPLAYRQAGRVSSFHGFRAHAAVAGSDHGDFWTSTDWNRIVGAIGRGDLAAPGAATLSALDFTAGPDYWAATAKNPIRRGHSGNGVTHVQGLLGSWRYPVGTIDGWFGPATEAAVKQFQRDAGIPADGKVGPQTRGKMEERYYSQATPGAVAVSSGPPYPGVVLGVGDSGPLVRTIQQRLADRRWSIKVDGDYGPKTAAVVTKFQAEAVREGYDPGGVDGLVGPKTWGLLWSKPRT